MKRGLRFRRQKRIPVGGIPLDQRISMGTAPRLGRPVVVNPRPEQMCCPCCSTPCHSPDQHTDGGCGLVGHEVAS